MKAECNCCDGIYNSLDIHFTSECDNKCAHCIDSMYCGVGATKPDVDAIVWTIIENHTAIDDVLFLGGEPCLYLDELLECVKEIKLYTSLKVFVTTAMPKTCYDNRDTFIELLEAVDGLNLSLQHRNSYMADKIRGTDSCYPRNEFYKNLPYKHKIRGSLSLVKPFLCGKESVMSCLRYFDDFGFGSIKLAEVQQASEAFVSFEDIFDTKLKSPYAYGCQTRLDLDFKTPVILKRSCFLCEDSLKASFMDGVKVVSKLFKSQTNNFGVVYADGTLMKGWV